MKLGFSRLIFEKHSNIKVHQNPSSGRRDVPCEHKHTTDGLTDMTKLTVAFRNFANAPKDWPPPPPVSVVIFRLLSSFIFLPFSFITLFFFHLFIPAFFFSLSCIFPFFSIFFPYLLSPPPSLHFPFSCFCLSFFKHFCIKNKTAYLTTTFVTTRIPKV
jgi:hypothetical protein